MAKKHIALVGGQPYPVYRGIIDHRPDNIVLVCSDGSEKQAVILEREIRKKTSASISIELFAPVDLSKIRSKISSIIKTVREDDEVVVNLSSGTKPWSVIFYEYFYRLGNARCIFIDQNNLLWDFTNNQSRQLNTSLTLEETFGLNNIKVKNHKRLKNVSKEDLKAARAIRALRNRWPREYKCLTEFIGGHPDQKNATCGLCSLSWNTDSRTALFHLEDKKGRVEERSLSSPDIYSLLFKTGWFELEVAQFLSEWEHAREVWINCELTNLESGTETTINEIDIIVNTGEKLLFVECKTQVYDGTDIDKFGNAVKNYGGLASKRIFITDAIMKPIAQEKCSQAKIPFFSMSEMRDAEPRRKLFFKFLSKELKIINEK